MKRFSPILCAALAVAVQGSIATAAPAPSKPSSEEKAAPQPDTAAPAAAPSAETAPAAAADPSSTKPDVSVAARKAPPPPLPPTLVIKINLSSQSMTVADRGDTVYSWPVSSARAGYRTPTGTFRPTWMSKMHYSRQYDLSPMPHSIFFSGGVAIHGSNAVSSLGRPASHGCVRLAPRNAAALFNLVNRHGKGRVKIVVQGKPPRSAPEVAYDDEPRYRTRQRYASQDFGSFFGYDGPGYYAPPARVYRQKPARYARPRRYRSY